MSIILDCDTIEVINPALPVVEVVAPGAYLVEVVPPATAVEVVSPQVPEFVEVTLPASPVVSVLVVPGSVGSPGVGGGIRYTYLDPVQLPDGTRTTFTTPLAYVTGTLAVYLNGLQEHFIAEDSATTFSFSTAPIIGDVIKLELNPA